jgi:hypothetical protein
MNDLVSVANFNPETVKVLTMLTIVINEKKVIESFNPYIAMNIDHYFVKKVTRINKKVFGKIMFFKAFENNFDMFFFNRTLEYYKHSDRFAKSIEGTFNILPGKLLPHSQILKIKETAFANMKGVLKKCKADNPFVIPLKQRLTYERYHKKVWGMNEILHGISKDETHIPILVDKLDIKIKYVELSPAIVSFIEQANEEWTNGPVDAELKAKQVAFFKELFDKSSNCKTFDEYLDRKVKELLSLDLSYLEDKKKVGGQQDGRI